MWPPCFLEVIEVAGLLKKIFKKESLPYCAVVVPAAGSSTRMGGEDKVMLPLQGVPVIVHTLRALEFSPLIHEIIVVTREDLIVPIANLCADFALKKVRKVIVGGETRAHSVRLGILEVSKQAELIAIQDGARPLLTERVIEDVVCAAAKSGAAAPAIPVKDTIKRAAGGMVQDTPDRSELYAVQTPQVFTADLIRAALYQAIEEKIPVTDDCSAVERLGMKVLLTPGSDENIKITTPTDLVIAEALLSRRGGI